ncbi:MAG: hypothetical protein FD127_2284 [Acidimicrobiaceae bacterium]|nr:MAG: hypothetical protein FD127_2284 [Acidimicrobiaceae bacterium]
MGRQAARFTDHGIVTPEAVVLELETAGLASRVCAGLIDLAIQLGALLVASFVIVLVGGLMRDAGESFVQTAFAVTITLILLGYPVVMETLWRGRTLGKMWMGLRAITVDGSPITARHATLRMMGGLVDKLLPPGGVTGALFVLGTRRHQRVGDLLAGTIVIRDPQRLALPPALWFPVPFGCGAYADSLDPTAMTVEQYTVLRAFLMRVHELRPDARHSVALALADRTAAVIGHQRPTQVHPETFILCAVARYQRRNFARPQPGAALAPPRPGKPLVQHR